MSAYLVEDRTINRVVTWLGHESIDNRVMTELAGKYGVDLVSEGWKKKLGQAMFQLNCDGVNARYGEGEAEKFGPLNFMYQPEQYIPLVQVLKSLQCWLYQCCEGDVPKKKLYQFFKEVESYVALKIVSRLPEYEKAMWG